jgi:quinolinate synthase
MVQTLPENFVDLSPEETAERIRAAREKLGKRIVVLGHHYQRDEIIQHADYRGDSYKLCLDANREPDAEFIVFCGVHFMAESADILTNKRVLIPNMAAGCSMADMANLFQVRAAWKQIESVLGDLTVPTASGMMKVMPITYINSAANLKGFVGERGGTVCTSTNAPIAVEWGLGLADKVLFFPDQHLGRNTGIKLGFDPEKDMVLWDPFKPLGGNTPERIKEAKFLLWKGHCSVHKRFTVEQIEKARREYPGVKVLVHPECEMEVVQASDLNGSTEFILKTVEASEPGSIWAIGTEINLVNRLAKENPDKTIFCLDPLICPCSTMYRIHPSFLLWLLEDLVKGEVRNEVIVPEDVKVPALKALERMLNLAPSKPRD